MIYRYKDHENKTHTVPDFFWKSELSIERQSQITSLLEILSADQITLLNDLIQDSKDSADWERDYQNSFHEE